MKNKDARGNKVKQRPTKNLFADFDRDLYRKTGHNKTVANRGVEDFDYTGTKVTLVPGSKITRDKEQVRIKRRR